MSAPPTQERRLRQQITQLLSCFEKTRIAVENSWPLDVMLSEYFSHKRELGSRDRRLIKESIYAYFRWKGWIDDVDLAREAPTRQLLLAGYIVFPKLPPALQLLAVDENMEFPPVTDASYATVKDWLELRSDKLLAGADLIPQWIHPHLAKPVTEKLIPHFQERPPAWIRCLHNQQSKVLQAFESAGYAATPHPANPRAMAISKAFPETSLAKATDHSFIIQDLASQVVSDVCIQLDCRSWWDSCCGSGGKAFAIADAGKAQVFASDNRSKMTRALQQRKKQLKISNLAVASLDATKERPTNWEFDGILVDAPCSGLGTWSRNPDQRWRLEEFEIEGSQQTQLKLLQHAAEVLQPGGTLVYSVCTLTTQETEDVTRKFLDQHPEFSRRIVPHPLRPNETSAELWVHPSDGPCSGMYIAIFQKAAT